MKLLINRPIPVLHDFEDDLPPADLWVRGDIVLEQKVNLFDEEDMMKTLAWLTEYTAFDTTRLKVYVEDCIKFYWDPIEA